MAAPPIVSPLPRVSPSSIELWWSPESDMWIASGSDSDSYPLAYSYDGLTWTQTAQSLFNGVGNTTEYGGGKWVAGGGAAPYLAYSNNGINWNSSSSPVFTIECLSVAYGNGRWLAGGRGTNQMAYSTDGINWTADTSGNALITVQCFVVQYANGMWIAGGAGTNTLIYSTDGINWNRSISANTIIEGYVYTIVYGGGKWVAGGVGTKSLMYSYDGIYWTASTSGSAILNTMALALAYGDGVWTAGGLGDNASLMYSYDGINWVPSPSESQLFVGGICTGMTYMNGIFNAVGFGTARSAYSYDGINWVASTSGNAALRTVQRRVSSARAPHTATRYILQTVGPGPWVGCSASTTKMVYSADGINWLSAANNIFTSQANSVAYGVNKWIAGGSGGNTMAYSTDGINWLPNTGGTELLGTSCNVVVYTGGQWLAGGSGTYQLIYSSDGINWAGAGSTFVTQCNTIAYNNDIWLAGGGNGSPAMLTSSDGQVWQTNAGGSAVFYSINQIAYANNLWIAVGAADGGAVKVASSPNANSWTELTSLMGLIDSNCKTIAYGNGVWVAGGEGTNRMAYSYDAVTWYENASGNTIFTSSCTTLYNANGVWVGGGSGGNRVGYSYDGLNWYPSYSGNTRMNTSLLGVATPPPANYVTAISTASNKIVTGLTPGATYSFVVQTDISGALSAPIPFRTVTTCDRPLPVTGLAVGQSISNGLLTLTATWTDPNDYATYHVYALKCTGTNDTIRESLETGLTGTLTLAGLDPTLPYTFRIQRGNDAGYSAEASVNTTTTSTYDPRTVTGLQVWLDAKDTAGDGSVVADDTTVTSWQDKSTNSNTATGSAVLKTDSVGRYLEFTASSYNLATSSWIYEQPYTIFIVDKPSNNTGPYTLIGAQSASTDQFNIRYESGSIISSTNGDNQALGTAFSGLSAPVNVWCFTNYGGKTAYWNKQVSGKASAADNLVDSLLSIGSNLGSAKYTGRMREVLIYTGRMTEANRGAISAYLYEKWVPSGFPTVPVDNGAILWLDAQDERTFYQDAAGANRVSTGPVGLWKDKSGADNHMVGTGTYNPIGLKMKGSFISGGTVQTANFLETADATLFLVGQVLQGSGTLFTHDSLGKYGLTASAGKISWHQGETIKNNEFNESGTPFIFYGRMRKGQLLSGTFVDASGLQTAYTVEGLNLQVAVARIKLGSNPVNYGEVLYYNRVLTDAEMSANTAYLSAKWNIDVSPPAAASLPSGARLWLDASNPDSLITSSGTVTAWRDRSGNGNNAVPFGSPTGSATGVVFNGSQRFKLPDGALPQGAYSTYIVADTSGGTILNAGSKGAVQNSLMNIKTDASGGGQVAVTTFDMGIYTPVAPTPPSPPPTPGGALWLAVGDGTAGIIYSMNGTDWSENPSTNSIFTDTCYDVAYANGIWLAGGEGVNQIVYSTDGINWSPSTSGNSVITGGCGTVVYGNSLWVAGGAGTNSIAYSTNGIDWTGSTNGNSVIGVCNRVAYGDGKWVAGGGGINQLAYSTNGMTWTASTSGNSLITSQCFGVAYGDGKWVACGGGTANLVYSTNGIDWSASSNGNDIFTTQCISVAYGNGKWVACGTGANQLAYSIDGIDWTASTSGNSLITAAGSTVEYGNGLWVAGGIGTNTIVYSSDGINWTASPSGSTLIQTRCWGLGLGIYTPSASGTYVPPPSSLTDTNVIPTGKTVIIESLYSGTGRSLFLSGLTGPTDTSSRNQDASNNYIGWDMSGSYMNGTIKEILVYPTAHTTAQRQQVESYLKNKWYASTSYTPSSSGTVALWLDSDPATFSYTGTGIRIWYDKSTNANASQNTIWAQPIYSLDPLTNKYGVQFGSDGIATGFTVTPFTNTSSFSIFAVQRADFTSDVSGDALDGFTNTVYDASGFRVGTGVGLAPNVLFSDGPKAAPIAKRPAVTSQVMSTAAGEYVNGAVPLRPGWVAVGANTGNTNSIAISYDGATWTDSVTAGGNNPFSDVSTYGIAWNGSYWLAAGGTSATVAKSLNGITWTSLANPFTGGAATGIAWNGSYWVVVGYNEEYTVSIAKTFDGIAWTASTNNPFTSGYARGIGWNGSYWIAVGTNSDNSVCIAKSFDGMIWASSINNPFYGRNSRGIAWNGSYWIAVGENSDNSVCIAKSTDGMTWTNSTDNPFTGGTATGIAWNGSYWLAVGYNSDNSVCIAKSTDGITWTASTENPFAGSSATGIGWNGSYWVVVGTNVDNTVASATSSNGMTWTNSTNNPFAGGSSSGIAYGLIPATPTTLPAVTTSTTLTIGYAGGSQGMGGSQGQMWIATATGGTTLAATSTDGENWTGLNNDTFFDGTPNEIVWNGTYWLAAGFSGNITLSIAKSTDGMTWTPSTNNPFTGGAATGIAWNGSYWIAVGYNETGTVTIAKSSDGENWTALTYNPFSGGGGSGIAWNGLYWVVVGINFSNTASSIAKSSDGEVWTVSTDSPFTNVNGIAWNGNLWVAVGYTSDYSIAIARSTNGIIWTPMDSPFTIDSAGVGSGIAWNGTYWVAVGFTSGGLVTIANSLDGITWSASVNNPFGGGQGIKIAWNGSYWIAVGYDLTNTVYIAKSSDSRNWTAIASPFNGGEGRSIAYGGSSPAPAGMTPSIKGAMRGYIYELVVYNSALSTSDRQAVEGYLAWKWGVQDLLPTTHPYFLAPP